MEYITNRTFDELTVGDSAELSRTISQKDIELYAAISGDVNPAHVDAEYAKTDIFHQVVAHGMWSAMLFSTILGTKLPGPGTIYLGQTFKFLRPVTIGDTITATVTVASKNAEKHVVELDCRCVNQAGKEVITGIATVMAPTEPVKRERKVFPEVEFKNTEIPG